MTLRNQQSYEIQQRKKYEREVKKIQSEPSLRDADIAYYTNILSKMFPEVHRQRKAGEHLHGISEVRTPVGDCWRYDEYPELWKERRLRINFKEKDIAYVNKKIQKLAKEYGY